LDASGRASNGGKAEKLAWGLPRKFHPWQLLPTDGTRCPCRFLPQPALPAADGSGLRRPVATADKRIPAGAGDERREPTDDAECRLVGDFEAQVELVRGAGAERSMPHEAGREPYV